MGIKRKDDCRPTDTRGVLLQPLHHVFVPAMDTVENTDGQIDRPRQRPERPEIVEDLHADQTPRRRETSGRLMMRAFT